MKISSRGSGALLVLALSASADAQPQVDETASVSMYDEGRRLYEAKQFDLACPKFEASLRLSPDNLATRGMLALCYEQVGKLASAWVQFREVRARAERVTSVDGPTQVEFATKKIAALEPQLAHVVLQVEATPGLRVSMNGVEVPSSALGSPLAVDAGRLLITAEAPGWRAWSTETTIKDGEAQRIDVPVLTPAEPDTTTSDDDVGLVVMPPRTLNGPRIAALGLAGAGVVGLAIGSWVGLDARASRDDARALGCNEDLSMCPSAALGTANSAYSRSKLSTVFFAGSGALIAAGAVVWLVGPSPSAKRVQLRPTIESGGIGALLRVEL